jgi:hypothetical protein
MHSLPLSIAQKPVHGNIILAVESDKQAIDAERFHTRSTFS